MSSAVTGGVAGAIAVKLTEVICRGARYEVAAFVTGGIYTGLVIMLGILSLAVVGLQDVGDLARALCAVIGLWLGLFMMLEALSSASPVTAAE
jgi:hypothetical protein